ncbi:hypothetical protein SeLEV6574_g00913 [Synchytrium endobioticum]|uniref:Uncharacterized protein n=1 Tax=Synchytrium endobioticum TaxID=286115 RepID=A0A507DFR5_9FUNG|nr:hypothetical protein SeLEV6574_g00913 [Synchytrium endobioticum]
MADIPSACTSQYQDYIHRPRYLVRHLETLVDYHDKAKSSKWDRYKRKQRALHEICMSIRGSGTKDDTVVIWGNGNFTSLGRKQGPPTKALKRHARRYTHIITYDEYMTSQGCSHCARRGVPEAVADDPRLSGYARAQGKSGHVLMAKRTRAIRMARVLEDAGCFEAHHCQSLYTVRIRRVLNPGQVLFNADEVSEIFAAPLHFFLDSTNRGTQEFGGLIPAASNRSEEIPPL